MTGKILSHYKILEPLGQGGMGVVYKAEDTKLQRTVALKFLPESLLRDAEAKERFIQEARAAAALNHPNICIIYEVDETAGRLFIAMEFVDGQNLRNMVKAKSSQRRELLPITIVIGCALQIAEGLQAAHEKGIIHRDIKSANIMITAKGQIKIMDFGLAKLAGGSLLTKDKTTMGTVAYMSPEQARGKQVDHRTDIWSFGMVLYEMFTGQLPFQGDHDQAVIYAIVNEAPEPITSLRADVPLELEQVVTRALVKNPAARYQHVDEMWADLKALQSSTNKREARERTSPPRPNNLPAQPTPLIGRQQELDAITQLVLRDEVRLVTLTGPGGTGKTRLGLQAATNLIEAFADGAFFVSLAPINDPTLVLSTIAETLSVFENPTRSLAESVIAYLREKRLLLLLDNFEHVMAAAPVAAELLAACPQLKILATSRMVLRLTAEHEFPVPPLATPDPQQALALEAITPYAAIELFTQRAKAVKPDFVITHENAQAIAEICYRLDGLPLAIELAAARLRLFSPQAMLGRLGSRLELLKGGARDTPARHQTLRHAIAWSYDLLTAEEKALFRRLAVFAGGCTLEAVEAVCKAMSDHSISTLDGIAALIDKSLLRQDQTVDDEPRFMMLETIREYALECLQASGDGEAVRRAHAEFFIALAEKTEPELTGPKQKLWLNKLTREYDNFRAVLKWVEDTGETDHGLRLGGALWRYWLVRGHMPEGYERLAALLALPGAAQRTRERAKVLNAAATITHEMSHYTAARPLLAESLDIWREIGDKKGVAMVINNLAWIAVNLGELDTARALGEEGLALYRELGDKRGMALAFNNLGWVANCHGDFTLARPFFESSLNLRREIGDERGVGFAKINLGWIEGMLGYFDQAVGHLEEAYTILQDLGDKQLIAFALSWRGFTAAVQGDFARARMLLEESLPVMKEIANVWGMALDLCTLGIAAHEQGDHELAENFLQESLSWSRSCGHKWGIVFALNFHGHVALERNDVRRALACYAESLRLSREMDDKFGRANALIGYGRLALAVGNLARAARLFAAAEALHATTGALMPAFVRKRFDRAVSAARAELGETAFVAEYTEGKNMTAEQATAYASDLEKF